MGTSISRKNDLLDTPFLRYFHKLNCYHQDFEIMAKYFIYDKLVAIQYKVPIKRKRSAFVIIRFME